MKTFIAGYKKKPVWIFWTAYFFFLLPMISLLQYAILLESMQGQAMVSVLTSREFIAEVLLSWSAAVAILAVNQLSFYYFTGLSIYVVGMKCFHFLNYQGLERPLDILMTAAWFTICALLLMTTLKTPYLNPRSRWWRQPERFEHLAYGVLQTHEVRYPIVSLNLSEGGMFLKLDERVMTSGMVSREVPALAERRTHNPIGTLTQLNLDYQAAKDHLNLYPSKIGALVDWTLLLQHSGDTKVDTLIGRGEIVWISKDPQYQYGLGLRFTDMPKSERRKLEQYLKGHFKPVERRS